MYNMEADTYTCDICGFEEAWDAHKPQNITLLPLFDSLSQLSFPLLRATIEHTKPSFPAITCHTVDFALRGQSSP